jgi:aldose sugar dehydrogenase
MMNAARLAACSAAFALLCGTTLAGAPPAPEADRSQWTLTPVAEGLNHPWGLAFLPGGDVLVTERDGGLRVIRGGKLVPEPVTGVPAALTGGQGGLFDVIADPLFSDNRTIYLAFSSGDDKANATTVISAVFDGKALSDVKTIFQATPKKDTLVHYGGRLLFLPDGTLLISLGDGFIHREEAQNLANDYGKIVRINKDGTIPADNPFAGQDGKRGEIFTWGHRNVQGLARDPVTGTIYESEHGAAAGDEINVLKPGANYGWPSITYAMDYSGAVISPETAREGMEQPIAYWTDETLAPSGLAVYRGTAFPQWDGDLLVGSLTQGEVRRLDLDAGGKVVGQDRLFKDADARIRDVRVAPDGTIWLLTDTADGKVLRADPGR